MVLKDYKCPTHGYFESDVASCFSDGCEANVMRVHLTAPSIKSERSKRADKTAKQLAIDFKMTNIKTTREGENQSGYFTRNNTPPEPQEPRPRDSAIWGGNVNGLNMKSLLSGRAVQSVRGEPVGLKPSEAGNLTGPKTASYLPDHENLKIK
jgi:hypothetical protein